VRLHSLDENVAGQVAALLSYLRALQRKTGVAIVLVHHARKSLCAVGESDTVCAAVLTFMPGSILFFTSSVAAISSRFRPNTVPLRVWVL